MKNEDPEAAYREAAEYIDRQFVSFRTAGRTAYHEGLQTMERMCQAMGDPQRRFAAVHVAGTNGKGSVCHMLAAALRAAGCRTGLYTSPHMHDMRERIRIDGVPIAGDDVAAFVSRYRGVMEREGLSYFEMTTAMAFDCFARHEVDVAVIETGLGGRLDATNVITPVLSIITNIGLDHTDILGDTLAAVAGEKAGIIKPGVPVLIGESHPETMPVFEARAAVCGSNLTAADRKREFLSRETTDFGQRLTFRRLPDGQPETFDTDLAGAYQSKNMATVLCAVDILNRDAGFRIDDRALCEGLRTAAATTGFTGRWQILSRRPTVIADGGHNVHGFSQSLNQLKTERRDRLRIVIGMAADKDIDGVLSLLPADADYYFTAADTPRALAAGRLAELAAAHSLHGTVCASPAEALAQARRASSPDDLIFVCGSLYLVSEIV